MPKAYTLELIEPFGVSLTAVSPAIEVSVIDTSVMTELLDRHHLVLLRGFKAYSREEFLAHSSKMVAGHQDQIHWSFGPVMELKRDHNPQNYLFSTEKVPFHWDGAFHEVPSFLLFHCLEAPSPAAGGETIFTAGSLLYRSLSEVEKKSWSNVQLTYRTEKKAHYGGQFSSPLLTRHERTGVPLVRFAERVETDLNPVSLEIEGLTATEAHTLVDVFTHRLYDKSVCYTHQWQDGDYLIVDNLALLHGRNAFRADSPRHIRRIQLK